VAIGFGAADPKNSDEYHSVAAQLSEARTQVEQAQNRADGAEAIASRASSSAASQSASLAAREASVAAREAAVSATEQQVAANSISEGTWTVGVDVEPGTYRTKEAVSDDCYWEITRSGSNGGDIIENDIVTGGFATVTLRAGQDFTNNRCGTFVKQ
jgi:hypothetical protein